MNQSIESLSSLTKLTSYTSSDVYSNSVSVHDGNLNNLVSSAFNKISGDNTQYKDILSSIIHSETPVQDPETLLKIQHFFGEHINHISLMSTLVRKMVAVVETLGKSQ